MPETRLVRSKARRRREQDCNALKSRLAQPEKIDETKSSGSAAISTDASKPGEHLGEESPHEEDYDGPSDQSKGDGVRELK